MNTLLLDGGELGHAAVDEAGAILIERLGEAGVTSERLVLRDLDISACRGCFKCWLSNPGVCCVADNARDVAERMARADLIVFLTPVVFGGYSWQMKKALDRSICNIKPFFTTLRGETHHFRRYDRAPRMLHVGVQESPDEEAAAAFAGMSARHALNMHAAAFAAGVVTADAGRPAIETTLDGLLQRVGVGVESEPRLVPAEAAAEADLGLQQLLDVAAAASDQATGPGSALLLVGSPRGGRSTSMSLASYLNKGLEEAGVETATVTVKEALSDDSGRRRLHKAVRASDLLVLAFPLYVDSLPAPLIRVLEDIAQDPETRSSLFGSGGTREGRPAAVTAIVNNGFPEAHQNTYALAVSRRFAEEMGAIWAGGLALGGGGMVDGADLEGSGGKTRNIRLALDQGAAALASGKGIPAEAIDLMARPMLPASLYRLTANLGFRRGGKKNGVRAQMRDRPYASA